jgi:phosphoenolpyruvate synthase/pyruvate phosphate dikinase
MTDTSDSPFIFPFDTKLASLETVGGKGLNLLRLTQATLPVPAGFILSTYAYFHFVLNNGLDQVIQTEIGRLNNSNNLEDLESASQSIRLGFSKGKITENLSEEIFSAYQQLPNDAVAVRSSATAEDLPDLSFAGQQDTYLNIIGQTELIKAVINCWSSLWSAR